MEQFEKWFKYNIDEYPEEHEYCEMTWRAALEWIKTLPSSGTSKFEEPICFINEELGDT